MHPEIFSIGPISVKAYGLMLAISFFVGVFLVIKRAQKFGIPPVKIIDLSLVILISAIVGSRFFYVIYHLDEFKGSWLDVINPFQSTGVVGIAGLSMMGGVVLVLISSIIAIKVWKLPFWRTLDVFSPAFPLGMGITRIGCFLNGCCYGTPTDWFWGVTFPEECAAGWHYHNTHIHPTQLISSIAGFAMFAVLILLERKRKFAGFTFFMMLIFYSAFRFTIDFFRYYEPSMVFTTIGGVDISNNQLISFIIFIIASVALIRKARCNNDNEGISGNNDVIAPAE
ncbi:MAG: prolipoprotein diacylglyceryl transferase [candidate division Zixibacteria bacterium]|nr:prolipoprotein diacylglyceryl transferase [candidate division Zixibacteria bacterium]